MTKPGDTYYDILDVPHDASQKDIASSYRRRAKVLHPDVCESSDAEDLFKAVNEAYQTLRDPKKRAEYDTTIALAQVSPYGEYYQGGRRYRDPRTWYYTHHHQHYHSTTRDRPSDQDLRKPPVRNGIPRLFQVLLFYLSLLMAIVIIAELFLLPWIDGVNATDARSSFLEGNRWVEEEEYQKAIESYQMATTKLPLFSEAWRAKGLTEVKKAEGLSKLGRSDAEGYYRDAIRSFSHVTGMNTEDNALKKALATALLETGDGKRALNILTSAQSSDNADPEISALIQKIANRTRTPGGAGQNAA